MRLGWVWMVKRIEKKLPWVWMVRKREEFLSCVNGEKWTTRLYIDWNFKSEQQEFTIRDNCNKTDNILHRDTRFQTDLSKYNYKQAWHKTPKQMTPRHNVKTWHKTPNTTNWSTLIAPLCDTVLKQRQHDTRVQILQRHWLWLLHSVTLSSPCLHLKASTHKKTC